MNYHIQWLQAKWYRMQPRLIFKAHDPVKAASNYTGNEIPCFSLKEDRQERLSSSLLIRGRLQLLLLLHNGLQELGASIVPKNVRAPFKFPVIGQLCNR